MRAMQTTRQRRTPRTLGMLATFAGLLVGLSLAPQVTRAQTAAQTAALAGLSRLHGQSSSLSGVEATNVPLNQPSAIAFDAAGNLYIADTDDHMIREVNIVGVITIVAGTGEQGFAGDGGAATSALLDSPAGVALDSSGNLYIADTHNQRIREVSSGMIATIAGTGAAGFSGDGATATAAGLSLPTAIAVDIHGNLYIADTNNHRIREVSNRIIQTVAGNGDQSYSGDGGLATAAGLDSPGGIAVDAAFNLYLGDTHNQRVRMVTAATGIISTLAGTGIKGFTADGSAFTVELSRPRGVAVDASGNVYVADSDNNRVRSIAGSTISTIAGDGSEGFSGDAGAPTSATLDTPRALAASGTGVVIADTGNDLIREVSGGAVDTISGQPSFGAESLAISGPLTTVYGTGTGTVTVAFANGGRTGTGIVTFYDGISASPSTAGFASLSGNTGVLNTRLFFARAHPLVASYAGDANNPPITSGVYVLLVTPAPVQTTLAASSQTVSSGTPVTLLATVASTTSGLPAGTVNFYDGATLLNSTPVPMSGGTAALTFSTLPPGTQTLTAVYSGNTNFLSGTSPGLTETVLSAGFTIAISPATQTILPLQSAHYTITLTPATSTFTAPVSLAVSGLPAGVTASFAPSSIAAGAGTSTDILTVNANSQTLIENNNRNLNRVTAATALPLLIMPVAFTRRARKVTQRLSRTVRMIGIFFMLALMLTGLAGCGAGGFFSHGTQNYTVTITAVSGPNTHTAIVTLIVQ
jgi:sugar lactone lactonase YvrE